MGRPLYPDQPHRTLGEQKKEEPVKEVEEPKATVTEAKTTELSTPIVETKAADEEVETPYNMTDKKSEQKSEKKFNLKNLRKKKER